MKDNKSKVIAIIALMIAVVGLGVGFAAFSSSLTISSGATVTPDKDDWNIAFDKTYNTVGYDCSAFEGNPTITTNPTVEGTTISGLEVAFTEPGQAVFCEFKVANTGKYDAYLTKVEYADSKINCAAQTTNLPQGYTQADATLVANACKGIISYVSVDQDLDVEVNGSGSLINGAIYQKWQTNKSNFSIKQGTGFHKVGLYLEYQGEARADGPFTVTIPDLSLTYSTVDAAS